MAGVKYEEVVPTSFSLDQQGIIMEKLTEKVGALPKIAHISNTDKGGLKILWMRPGKTLTWGIPSFEGGNMYVLMEPHNGTPITKRSTDYNNFVTEIVEAILWWKR